MPPAQPQAETSRADWLPWFLAIFGAGCAVFVLIKGVVPARVQNDQLMQRVHRLETAAQSASSERATLEQAKGHLLEQYTSVQSQLSTAGKERERERQTQATARQEMGDTFAAQIAAGDIWLEQRMPAGSPAASPAGGADPGQLVIGIRDKVLFNGDRGEVTWKGRQLIKALAENLKHLPADQVYEIGGHFLPARNWPAASARAKVDAKPRSGWELSAKRAASVARCLEEDGGLAGTQLVAAGFSRYRPVSEDDRSRRIEIVLRRPQKI